ncbi:hypothetical protein ACRAWD_05510 [Caulobacter segnis]
MLPYPGSAYAKPPADAEPGALGLVANIQVLTSAGFAVLVPSLPLAADADPGQALRPPSSRPWTLLWRPIRLCRARVWRSGARASAAGAP